MKKVAGVDRFELPNEGVKAPCLTAWLYPCIKTTNSQVISSAHITWRKVVASLPLAAIKQANFNGRKNKTTILFEF